MNLPEYRHMVEQAARIFAEECETAREKMLTAIASANSQFFGEDDVRATELQRVEKR